MLPSVFEKLFSHQGGEHVVSRWIHDGYCNTNVIQDTRDLVA